MQELYRSDLLEALGWAIADSLWQMSLLWLIYQLGIAIPFRRKPPVKHMGAVLTLVIGTGWFFYSFFARFASERMLDEKVTGISQELSFSFTSLLNSTLPYFSTAYLMILALLFARLLYHFISTQKLKMELKPAIEWQHVVNRLTVSLGISREIFIYISEHISVPSTIGYLKPVILLPLATVNQLSIDQLEAVIIHEMTHIRRNDYIINLTVAFIETILFFNPFAHLLGRAVRKECELCCDDEVIRQQDPEAYARALLLLEKAKVSPALAMAVTGKQRLLLGRVKRILNIPDQEVKYGHKVLALCMLAGMIMLTGLLAPSRVSEQNRETTKVITQQVTLQQPVQEPHPLMMKVSTTQPLSAEKTVAKKTQRKTVSQKTEAIPVANEGDFEFVYLPGPPQSPMAPFPPAPSAAEIHNEGSYYRSPMTPGKDLPRGSGVPDPRDRKNPDILRNSKLRVAQDFAAAGPGYFKVIRDKALQFEELEKLESSISKLRSLPEQFINEFELNSMVESMVTTQEETAKQRVQIEREKVVGKKTARPVIRTVAVDQGMTITIIQDDAQIEITVKNNR